MGKILLKIKDKKFSGDFKEIFMLSWPIMVGMILQSLLGTVDTYFIAKLGTNEAAAAALSNSASSVIFVISTLVSAGTIALVSRNYGEGDMDLVRKFSGQSFTLSLILELTLSIICFLNSEAIIKLIFNPEPTVLILTEKYLSIIFIGTMFVFLNSVLRTIIQALGDTLTPLIIFGISNVINAILDPILMFTFHIGIGGQLLYSLLACEPPITEVTGFYHY